MDRRWTKVAAVLVLAGGIAMVSAPASAAAPRGPLGTALDGWARANVQSGQADCLVTRLGAWLVHMAKVLTGETDGEATNASGAIDPTSSGEATTDSDPGLAGLASGS